MELIAALTSSTSCTVCGFVRLFRKCLAMKHLLPLEMTLHYFAVLEYWSSRHRVRYLDVMLLGAYCAEVSSVRVNSNVSCDLHLLILSTVKYNFVSFHFAPLLQFRFHF